MRIFAFSVILALFAVEHCWASALAWALEARQVPVVEFFFEGPFISEAQGYGNFTISVPEDGSNFPISKCPSFL